VSPNRSIGWRDLVLFYLFMCLLALAVGLIFAVQGLWLVLPFSGQYNHRRKLELGCHGRHVEIGEFLNNFEKDELAFRLKDCIIRG
jgi:uncharacterized membrane protein